MDSVDQLQRGRSSYAERAWRDAFESLVRADRTAPLEAEDLERLARSAYMVGRDDAYLDGLERAHQAHLDGGRTDLAVRCCFWIGHNLLFRAEVGRAAGWFARAQRLLDTAGLDGVERGYLLIPVWLEQMAGGHYDAGLATAAEAARVGERFGDADLVWLARDEQARALMRLGRVDEGLPLVNEALVVADAGELSPIVTGILYCNTILFCRDTWELRHVQEWTDALTRWCERQPQMVAHNGLCLVHRAEILLIRGAFESALQEARQTTERFTAGVLNQIALGKAQYFQAEAHRLRGEFAAAQEAYGQASRLGCEPQPGLALLRLAQGNADAAAAAIRRAVGETTGPHDRAGLLPAYVDIMVAIGSFDHAREACRELDAIAEHSPKEALVAMAAFARGTLTLAEGRTSDALPFLRRAQGAWSRLGATYEVARVRVLLGLACRALGDGDTADLELAAAQEVFERLGATPDRARVDSLTAGRPSVDMHGLTERELRVLRLVAAGMSNRQIAAELVISEHTVARHLQNTFAKLGVASRTAAIAFAQAHDLL